MTKVRIYHNINPAASFGLNTMFDSAGKRPARLASERHELVLVFEYEAQDRPGPRPLLEEARVTFNVGTSDLAGRYRARRLRSLSVGDVVLAGDDFYACAPVGWELVDRAQLRILPATEADAAIRERFEFGPHERLSVTVPLEETEASQ